MKAFLNILLLAIVYVNPTLLYAQQSHLSKTWESNVSQIAEIEISQTLVDNENESYVLSNTLNTANNSDLVLSKYDTRGTLIWSYTKDAAALNDYGAAMSFAPDGHIMVTGVMETAPGIEEAYLAKISPSGQLIWENTWSRFEHDTNIPTSIYVSLDGVFYLAAITAQNESNSDITVVKFSNTGLELWQSSYDFAGEHDVPSQVFESGDYIGISGASAATALDWDMLTLQLDPSTGSIEQEGRISLPGVGFDKIADANWVDVENALYIVGYTQANGAQHAKTIKLDASLNVIWTKEISNGISVTATSVVIDNSGAIIVTGYMRDAADKHRSYIVKYDELGNEEWLSTIEEPEDTRDLKFVDATVLDDNSIAVIGSSESTLTSEIAMMLFDNAGERLTHSKFGTTGSETRAQEIVKGGDGSLHISGTKTSTAGTEVHTMSIKEVKKTGVLVMEDDIPHHLQGHVMVSFSPSQLNMNRISDRKFGAGHLEDFIKAEALSELNGAFEEELDAVPTFKVFSRLVPDDNTSVARDGRNVQMPKFWTHLLLDLSGVKDENEAVTLLNDFGSFVKSAQLNHAFIPTSPPPPDDTFYGSNQASLHPTTAYPNWGINIEGAWDIELGCKDNVKIGIVDSGIYFTHEEFMPNEGDTEIEQSIISGGYNFWDSDSMGNQNDRWGHGTRTAGIITALRNNDAGIAGIVGGDFAAGLDPSPFYVMKITNDAGYTYSNLYAEESDFCEGMLEAATETGEYGYGLHLINSSWGHVPGPPAQTSYGTAYNCLLKVMWTCAKNGAIVTTSRGNFDSDAYFIPATIGAELGEDDWLLTIGASNENGQRPEESNGDSYSSAYDYIDVAAPGIETTSYSTMSSGDADINDVSPYEPYSGTSASAPHALGVAALMYNHHHVDNGYSNNLAIEDIEYILETYNQSSNNETLLEIGHGIIDAELALQHVDKPDYGYEVVHSTDPVTTVSTMVAGDQEQYLMLDNVYDIPEAEYIYDSYLVEQTYQIQLDPGIFLIDYWPRHSASSSNAMTPDFEIIFFPDEFEIDPPTIDNNNLVTITTRTHTKFCTDYSALQDMNFEQLANDQINQYFPSSPTDVRTAFSLYTSTSPLGVDEQENSVFVSLSPNPASSVLTLKHHSKDKALQRIIVIDNTGKRVMSQESNGTIGAQNTLQLNIEDLATGLYTLTLLFEDETVITRRFVKSK